MQSALGNASSTTAAVRMRWQTVLAGADAGQEVADLAVHHLGLLRLGRPPAVCSAPLFDAAAMVAAA